MILFYAKIRKSLYHHSIIGELNSAKNDNSDDKNNITASQNFNQPHNAASSGQSKRLDHEQNRLLNNLSSHEIRHNKNNRRENYFQGRIEQIRRQLVANIHNQVNMIHQMRRII